MRVIAFVLHEQTAFRAIHRTLSIPYFFPANLCRILRFCTQTSPEAAVARAETPLGTEKESKEGDAKSLSWSIEKLSKGDSVSSAFRRWMGDGLPIHRGDIFHMINRLRRLKSAKRALEVRYSVMLCGPNVRRNAWINVLGACSLSVFLFILTTKMILVFHN